MSGKLDPELFEVLSSIKYTMSTVEYLDCFRLPMYLTRWDQFIQQGGYWMEKGDHCRQLEFLTQPSTDYCSRYIEEVSPEYYVVADRRWELNISMVDLRAAISEMLIPDMTDFLVK